MKSLKQKTAVGVIGFVLAFGSSFAVVIAQPNTRPFRQPSQLSIAPKIGAIPVSNLVVPVPPVPIQEPLKPAAVPPVVPKPSIHRSVRRSENAPVQNPAPAPSPTVSAPISENSAFSIQKILDNINAFRTQNGLSAATLNSQLDVAAAAKSKHMSDNNYFAHTAPDGTTDWSFIQNAGYKYSNAGANLALGSFADEKALVDAWIASPGHRENLLADFGQDIGLGICGQYYTMFIAKPM